MSEQRDVQELDDLQDIVKSPEWRAFRDIAERHKNYLRREMEMKVREGEYRLADRLQAKLEDCEKLVELVGRRLDELKKQKG